MKKIFNTTFALALGMLALASCSDDYEYTGAENTHEGSAVAFAEGTSQSVVFGVEDTESEVNLTVVREDAENAEDIPVQFKSSNAELFSGPQSVHFDAGETEKTLAVTVKVAEMEAFTTYSATIYLESNVYSDENVGIFDLTVTKEDYVQVGAGVYTSNFFGAQWESPLMYSEATDTYRITDWVTTGYPLEFQWNKETGECSMASAQTTGYVHPSYGMIYAYGAALTSAGDTVVYDADENTFYFGFTWRVSAGSFGSTMETFTITELNQ